MIKNCTICLWFFIAGLTVSANAAVEISGKVISVIDGNTLEFLSLDNETFKLVLAGIDCPELKQEFGEEAKLFLDKLIVGKEAIVIIEGKDRLGNRVGSLRLSNNKDPRLDLLEKGLAWTVEKNPNPAFEEIKEEAKKRTKGLWKQENPVAPWVYRRQQTMLTAKSG